MSKLYSSHWKQITTSNEDPYSAQIHAQTAYISRTRTAQRQRIQEGQALLRSRLSQRAQSVKQEIKTLLDNKKRSESVRLQDRSLQVRISRESNSAAIRSRQEGIARRKYEAAATIRWQSQSLAKNQKLSGL